MPEALNRPYPNLCPRPISRPIVSLDTSRIEAARARTYEIRKLNSKGFYTEVGDGEVEIGGSEVARKDGNKEVDTSKLEQNLIQFT
jgi:hypothetical protein